MEELKEAGEVDLVIIIYKIYNPLLDIVTTNLKAMMTLDLE